MQVFLSPPPNQEAPTILKGVVSGSTKKKPTKNYHITLPNNLLSHRMSINNINKIISLYFYKLPTISIFLKLKKKTLELCKR